MRVQVVNNKNPFTLRVGVHGSREMVDELRFGTGRLQRGGDDLAGHHVEAGRQRGGTMTYVLKLLFSHTAGLNRFVGGVAFDGLERCRLIHTHGVSAVDRGLARRFEVGLADLRGLALEGLGVLLRRVEPHFTAVRLKRRLLQVTTHLRDGNALDDLTLDHFVAQFPVCPMADGATRQFRRLTCHGQDFRDLRGRDFPRAPRPRRVGQDFEDGFTEPARFGAFPNAERLPSLAPPLPPNTDLLPVEPPLHGNLFVQAPLNPENQNRRALDDPFRRRARPTEFLQDRQLLLADPDLGRFPRHLSPPLPHNRGSRRYTQIPDFLKPRFRVVELAWSCSCPCRKSSSRPWADGSWSGAGGPGAYP